LQRHKRLISKGQYKEVNCTVTFSEGSLELLVLFLAGNIKGCDVNPHSVELSKEVGNIFYLFSSMKVCIVMQRQASSAPFASLKTPFFV
jgi:hypothetical protein